MTDDFDSEPRATALPFALLVILVGGAVLVAAMLLVPHLLARPALQMLLIGGAGAGLLLWLIGMVLGMRRSPLLWQLGAAIVLTLGGAAAGYGAHRQYHAQSARDASSFAEAELATDGTPELPRGAADRGPVSRAYVEAIAETTQDAREYESALGGLGVGGLTSPYLLSQGPEVLERCDAIGALKPRLETLYARRRARIETLSDTIAAAPFADPVKQGIDIMANAGATGESLDAMLGQERARLESTEALCHLLARRSWRNDMGHFAFSNAADEAAFRRISGERRAGATARAEQERAAQARWREGQEKVRAALSR